MVQLRQAKVRFYGTVRELIPSSLVEIEVPQGSSVGDVLMLLADRYGPRFQERILKDDGSLQGYVRLFLNGDELPANGLGQPLEAGPGANPEMEIYVIMAPEGG